LITKDIEAIIEENMGLIISEALKAKQRWGRHKLPFRDLWEDLIAEGKLAMQRAIKNYKEDKGRKFSSYAVLWIRKAMNTFLSKEVAFYNHIVFEDDDKEENDIPDLRDSSDWGELKALVLSIPKLSQRERQMILWRLEGLSLQEIAEKLGITFQAVAKALKKIQPKIEKVI